MINIETYNENYTIDINKDSIDEVLIISSPLFKIQIISNKEIIPNQVNANTIIYVNYLRYFKQGTGELQIMDQDRLVYSLVENVKSNNTKKINSDLDVLFEILFNEAVNLEDNFLY